MMKKNLPLVFTLGLAIMPFIKLRLYSAQIIFLIIIYSWILDLNLSLTQPQLLSLKKVLVLFNKFVKSMIQHLKDGLPILIFSSLLYSLKDLMTFIPNFAKSSQIFKSSRSLLLNLIVSLMELFFQFLMFKKKKFIKYST